MNMVDIIRQNVDKHLPGIIIWSKHVRMLNDGTRDFATVEINPPVRKMGESFRSERFQITCESNYQVPPLGRVRFVSITTPVEIEGQIKDDSWSKIAAEIKSILGIVEKPIESPIVKIPSKPVIVSPDGRLPRIGTLAIFCMNPGEGFSGMTEFAAIVTRVRNPITVDLTVFPPTSEIVHRENVPRVDGEIRSCRWQFADERSAAEKAALFEAATAAALTRRDAEQKEPIQKYRKIAP